MNVFIRLPDCWSIEQVEFLHDFIELLHDAVWDQYGQELCKHWARSGSNRDLFDDDGEDERQASS